MRRSIRIIQLTMFLLVPFWSLKAVLCQPEPGQPPAPWVKKGQPVDWWFVFKFNAETFPRPAAPKPTCLFGGTPGGNKKYTKIGQDYVYATADHAALVKGPGYIGDSTDDPVGATFDEIYNGNLFYIIWNDQFYRSPILACEGTINYCEGPWAHSKGVLAWDASGNGFVMQVTTPSWPVGTKLHPRVNDGDSLGCVNDNDVDLSQDFFALKLNKVDLLLVLQALAEEGAVTDTSKLEIVKSGGPQEVLDLVATLGKQNIQPIYSNVTLSTNVKLIAKAGGLGVPPWQLVSGLLGGVSLRVAHFWDAPVIHSTTPNTPISCWPSHPSADLQKPGSVEIAETGIWDGTTIGLTGASQQTDGKSLGANHAKIGVSTAAGSSLTIFGDMNQDGILVGDPLPSKSCLASQNGRGGMFFVLDNLELHNSVAALLKGATDPPQ
jgi:hypothetical protein